MRVTVRVALLGGSLVVLLTTVLLWSQCRPPTLLHLPVHHPPQHHHQLHQSPLHATHHQGPGGGGGEEAYVEVEYGGGSAGDHHQDKGGGTGGGAGTRLTEIPCVINRELEVSCRRDQADVYVPFSFLHNYFEVYGHVEPRGDGTEVFEWSHSYSRVYQPQGPYSPTATFLNFELYNVEARDRVKCISGTEGVPISTQWQSTGYTYPIQIAQFGLSHYCKHLAEDPPEQVVLEDGEAVRGAWEVEGEGARLSRVRDPTSHTTVLTFSTPESSQKGSATLQVPEASTHGLLVLSLSLLLRGNSSLSVGVELRDKKTEVVMVHYIRSNTLLQVKDRQIYYGLGEVATGWLHITRNLLIDVQKGAASSSTLRKRFKKVSKSKVRMVWLAVSGEGSLANITMASTQHLNHFYDAADWLLRHQDHQGGWPIPVPRKVISGVLELGPGWYSAMAQGQAMSLLVRAAHHSGDPQYLQAALRATQLFSFNASQGGVRTYFPGDFVWYEEYPTTPSLFVLNGFIYSLLGLYDLKEYSKGEGGKSGRLFEEGMKSLKKLLPLFDTGWGSLYDLRHFTTHVAPNRARWDYHTTHITQLLVLASLDSDPVLSTTAQRWQEYMNGHRAKHN